MTEKIKQDINYALVESTRPHRRGVESGLEVLEIGAADIPVRGYVDKPLKTALLSEEIPSINFAKYKDIVIVIKGSVGKVGIISSYAPSPGKGGWVLGQSAIIVRVNSDAIDPDSLLIYLRSKIGQSLLNNITSGSTIPFIKISDLKEIPIIIPDKKTQEDMSNTLETEDKISQKIKKLQDDQVALTDGVWNI